MFHVTDIQKYLTCPYMYIYSTEEDYNKERVSFFRLDVPFLTCAEKKLKVKNAFYGQVGDPVEKTLRIMNNYDWLIRARFEYAELRVNIFMMHKNEDSLWDLYFGKSELSPHEDEAQYMADCVWVLKNLGVPLSNNYFSIHFNADYEQQDNGEVDYDSLIRVSRNFYNNHNNPSYEINMIVDRKERDLTPILKEMKNLDVSTLQGKIRTSKCTKRYKCSFYDNCWPQEKKLPDNSILTLVNSEHKYDMYRSGKKYLRDADANLLEGSKLQYAQVMADKNGGLFVDYLGLKGFLDASITFPLYFLDFEWDTYAVPIYKGMHPFDVALFQYSLHILESPEAELKHKEYIGVNDCRKALMESLIENLAEKGSIVTFNGVGAEEIRMRELSKLYPERKEEIDGILERMVDFSLPFSFGLVYHTKMKGYYSLKQIVEIFGENMSYKNLDISKAMNAVAEWRILEKGVDEEKEKVIRENLSAYCGMDTYSLYLVYKWFLEILKGKDNA